MHTALAELVALGHLRRQAAEAPEVAPEEGPPPPVIVMDPAQLAGVPHHLHAVYVAHVQHQNREGHVSYPRARMAADLGVSERTIDLHRAQLVALGLLRRIWRGIPGRTAVYGVASLAARVVAAGAAKVRALRAATRERGEAQKARRLAKAPGHSARNGLRARSPLTGVGWAPPRGGAPTTPAGDGPGRHPYAPGDGGCAHCQLPEQNWRHRAA